MEVKYYVMIDRVSGSQSAMFAGPNDADVKRQLSLMAKNKVPELVVLKDTDVYYVGLLDTNETNSYQPRFYPEVRFICNVGSFIPHDCMSEPEDQHITFCNMEVDA